MQYWQCRQDWKPIKSFTNFCFNVWKHCKVAIKTFLILIPGQLWLGSLRQGTLTYFVRGRITVRLTSCLTGLDSTKQVNMLLIQHKRSVAEGHFYTHGLNLTLRGALTKPNYGSTIAYFVRLDSFVRKEPIKLSKRLKTFAKSIGMNIHTGKITNKISGYKKAGKTTSWKEAKKFTKVSWNVRFWSPKRLSKLIFIL